MIFCCNGCVVWLDNFEFKFEFLCCVHAYNKANLSYSLRLQTSHVLRKAEGLFGETFCILFCCHRCVWCFLRCNRAVVWICVLSCLSCAGHCFGEISTAIWVTTKVLLYCLLFLFVFTFVTFLFLFLFAFFCCNLNLRFAVCVCRV